MVYDEELIKDIIEDLGDSEPDKLVLFILHYRNRPVLRTRMQKEALIYNQAYTDREEHEAYYFGGYSDDIDESYSTLSDTGMIKNSNMGMKLTSFGSEVITQMIEEKKDNGMSKNTELMEKSIGSVDDKSLVAITYHLFPKLAKESTIANSINPIIDSLLLNGKPLKEWNEDLFLECVRAGTIITVKRCTQ